MSHTRKLAAVMFTDIEGYTSLMQQSEQTAIQTRKRHREIFEPTTAKYGGKIIQYYGDGTLSIFESTVSAVQCGQELQKQFLQEPRVPVRIGIHTGDILVSDEDIIGDSVNLASRIESLGVPGCVLVSGKVAEEIQNQDDLPLKYLGSFHFKNDFREREVYALNVPGLVVPKKKDLTGKLETTGKKNWLVANRKFLIPFFILLLAFAGWQVAQMNTSPRFEHLAVMPFFNRMNDPSMDLIVDGLHEDLISQLQQAGIEVKARPTMMQYKGTQLPVMQIVDELDVEALIEGSVFRADDTLGINVRLVDGQTGNLVWNQSYQTDFRDVKILYGEMTRSIAKEIHQALSPKVKDRLKEAGEVNPEAYKAYMTGQQHWYKLTREGFDKALDYFEEARIKDPGYAPAYSGIASVWGGRLQQGFVSYQEAAPIIQEASRTAVGLGPDLQEVQYWLAVSNTWWLWDWEQADKAYKRCFEINPNSAVTHAYYSHYLLIMNRDPNEAIAHIQKAIERDPYNPLFQGLFGMVLNFSGKHDKVIELLSQTLAKSPKDPIALSTLRTAYHLAGEYEEAIDIWKRFYQARKDSIAVSVLEQGYEEGGYSRALQALAEMLIERSQTRHVTPWQIATLYTRAGMETEALDWLEKAYGKHDPNMPYISIDPIFDEIRNHPRFQALLFRMNLPMKGITA